MKWFLGCVGVIGIGLLAVCCADPTDDEVHYGWRNDEGRTETWEEKSVVHWDVNQEGDDWASLRIKFWAAGGGFQDVSVHLPAGGDPTNPGRLLCDPAPNVQTGQEYVFEGPIFADESTGNIVQLVMVFGDPEIWRAYFYLENGPKSSYAQIRNVSENSDGEVFIEYSHTVNTGNTGGSYGMQACPGDSDVPGGANGEWVYLDEFDVERDATYHRRTFHFYPSPLPTWPAYHFRQTVWQIPLYANEFSMPVEPH